LRKTRSGTPLDKVLKKIEEMRDYLLDIDEGVQESMWLSEPHDVAEENVSYLASEGYEFPSDEYEIETFGLDYALWELKMDSLNAESHVNYQWILYYYNAFPHLVRERNGYEDEE
jgi:hypothetical protein